VEAGIWHLAEDEVDVAVLAQEVSAETLDRVRGQSALRRLGDPQDVAAAVFFLCSEAARHITGAVLPLDGGYLV